MMKRLLLLSALPLVLALGCAAEEPAEPELTATTQTTETAAAAEPTTPPCDWITEAEATVALGQPSKYRSAAADGSSNCIIDPAEGAIGISVDFKVTADHTAWETVASSAPTISNLGDVAVWNNPTIAVKKGNLYLIATLSRMGGPTSDLQPAARAFAETIVPKM